MNPPRDLDTHHLFTPPAARTTWETRARALRQRILFACGLLPLPSKTPLLPRVTGTVDLPDITIENVALQTVPGFWLCGNVYRPKGKGPFPAIVNPHGHWANGRLEREPDVARAAPPPAPPALGRADLVNLAASLARQGFLVMTYDMVGYNDTDQVAHRSFGTSLNAWLWGISELGLQTWNSLRVVDYLGATGASGGGTQVFVLAAIDPRIQVSVPVNMVSAYMQGGCICENAPALRVGTDNPEIAATFAPKPQLLVNCTGDWSSKVPLEEGPTIRKVYDLYGAGDKLQWVQFNYQHNYNVESREAMYAFFRKWLLDLPGESEKPLALEPARLRVARPAGKTQTEVHETLRSAFAAQTAGLVARNDRRSREVLRSGLSLSLAVDVPKKVGRGTGRILLIVAESDAAAAPVAASLAGVGLVETLILPPTVVRRDALWNEFFSTYNRTPLGDRVQAIVDRLAARASRGRVDLIGVGGAGAWTLLARAVAPDLAPGATAVDLDRFPVDDDAAYADRLYAPGLRRAGDLRAAALLVSPGPLILHAAGNVAPWEPVAQGATVQAGALSPAELAAWLGN